VFHHFIEYLSPLAGLCSRVSTRDLTAWLVLRLLKKKVPPTTTLNRKYSHFLSLENPLFYHWIKKIKSSFRSSIASSLQRRRNISNWCLLACYVERIATWWLFQLLVVVLRTNTVQEGAKQQYDHTMYHK